MGAGPVRGRTLSREVGGGAPDENGPRGITPGRGRASVPGYPEKRQTDPSSPFCRKRVKLGKGRNQQSHGQSITRTRRPGPVSRVSSSHDAMSTLQVSSSSATLLQARAGGQASLHVRRPRPRKPASISRSRLVRPAVPIPGHSTWPQGQAPRGGC